MTPETEAGATAARALSEPQLSLLGYVQLLYFLCLFECAELRWHFDLGTSMQQVIATTLLSPLRARRAEPDKPQIELEIGFAIALLCSV